MTVNPLTTIEIPTSETESAVIIGIHGRGSSPHDLAGLARALAIPWARWILPAAPISTGYGYTWYSNPYTNLSPTSRAEFQQARDQLSALIRRVRYESGGKQTALIGFSQGGVLSLDLALRGPESVTAAVVLSGGLYDPEPLAEGLIAQPPPIFWAHGTHDGILPIGPAREQAALLRDNGIDMSFREYSLDHSISAEVVRDAREFLTQIMG